MTYIPRAVRRRVSALAEHRCGYCQTSQRISGAPMHIEHIVPLALGGTSDDTNLWLACAWCNSFKGTKISGVDPVTGDEVPLFNPRTQRWSEHFRWSDDGSEIVGMTAVGRATVKTLRLNNEYLVASRRQWVAAGWHPPS
ncbi:MAG TPA: HNH endonuclease [Anaerolineae bacterium]|nr:HNH endonuclease [Anaerolineae bacterium]